MVNAFDGVEEEIKFGGMPKCSKPFIAALIIVLHLVCFAIIGYVLLQIGSLLTHWMAWRCILIIGGTIIGSMFLGKLFIIGTYLMQKYLKKVEKKLDKLDEILDTTGQRIFFGCVGSIR